MIKFIGLFLLNGKTPRFWIVKDYWPCHVRGPFVLLATCGKTEPRSVRTYGSQENNCRVS
jgi:hypothetical protein